MESENETRPLLHDFENETWRSKARKRCLRIPSEVAITGIILGLFFVVVTLLIVLENMEDTKENELTLDKNLLASPFKYNKKVEDKSWQDKKISMKEKNKRNDAKWNKVNKGWKEFPDISGKINNKWKGGAMKSVKDNTNNLELPAVADEYGKDVDYSWEQLISLEDKGQNFFKPSNEDMTDFTSLLQSPKLNRNEMDNDWKRLSVQGWKDKEIRDALSNSLKERKEEIRETERLLQSPMSLDQLKVKINEIWKKKIEKGNTEMDYQTRKGKIEVEHQKNIKDDWKNKMNLLQSPKATLKNIVKADDGWKKLSEQGLDKHKSQKDMNDEWANKFGGLLKSPKPSTKKERIDAFLKKWTNYDQDGKSTNKSEHGENHQSFNFKDFLENIAETIKQLQKENKAKNSDKVGAEKENHEYASMDIANFMKNIIDAIKEQGKEKNGQLEKSDGSDKTSSKMENFQHSMSLNSNDVNINSGWKKLIEQGWKDQDIKEAIYKAWKESEKLLQSATGYNSMKWKKVNDGWKKLSNNSVNIPTRCPIFKAHRDLSLGSSLAAPPIDCALITEEVRRKFGRCIDLSFLPKSCKPLWRTKCFSSYKYRKIDGTCNNKIHPTWGKSSIPFVRMIAPEYSDGVSTIRKAKDGGPLPNARFLSSKLYSKRMKPDADTSLLFLYFGLLVDHDMMETGTNTAAIPCCEDFQENPQNRPKECLQLDILSDDPFYSPKNITCLNLLRSLPVNGECGGRREQLNKATSFLDGSAVYGSNMEHSKKLRTYSRGQLRTQLINNTPFMISAEGAEFRCGTPSEPLKCFEAGDSRVNMMVELTAMHTLWYREHNRVATELHKLNPNWNDETLYQETRRIVIGELQHITYSELLPLLLGEEAIEEYDLKIDESKQYEGYDDSIDATTFNVFGAAAFRFGHSLAPDMQVLLGANNSSLDKIALHKTFFSATILYHDGLDLLLRGAAVQRTQSVDSYITPEVREHLFQPAELDYGYDLAAVGIQRGRDHGLPPYIKWRSVCGFSEVKTWDDLYKIMDKDRADMLKNVYQSVDDIDLIPGALAENHATGSLLGPTYTCLMGRQFKKTRKGDRFWYETQNKVGSFTKGQLGQIYKSSMSRIVCDNSDNIKEIQRNAFNVPSDHNPVIHCSEIPKVDLTEWVFEF